MWCHEKFGLGQKIVWANQNMYYWQAKLVKWSFHVFPLPRFVIDCLGYAKSDANLTLQQYRNETNLSVSFCCTNSDTLTLQCFSWSLQLLMQCSYTTKIRMQLLIETYCATGNLMSLMIACGCGLIFRHSQFSIAFFLYTDSMISVFSSIIIYVYITLQQNCMHSTTFTAYAGPSSQFSLINSRGVDNF